MKRALPLFLVLAILAACGRSRVEGVRKRIEQRNYCETTEDCAVVDGKCPFDCYVLTNVGNVSHVETMIERHESTCQYGCVEKPPHACVGGKCVFLRDDCESLATQFDAVARDERFCGRTNMRNVAEVEPIHVGGTLLGVEKRPLEGPQAREGMFEYRLTIKGAEETKTFTIVSDEDVELEEGAFHRIDALNDCKYALLLASSMTPSPILDLFRMPEERRCRP